MSISIQNIYKSSILSNASAILLFHNHPSGNPKPSKEDIGLTENLSEAGKLLGIPVMDHIIVGGVEGKTYSFRENMPQLFDDKIDMEIIRKLTQAAIKEGTEKPGKSSVIKKLNTLSKDQAGKESKTGKSKIKAERQQTTR